MHKLKEDGAHRPLFAVGKIDFDFFAEIQYYVSRIVCLERLVSYESTKIHF